MWEVHPEVSFTVLLGHPASAPKKTWAGMWQRLEALRSAGDAWDASGGATISIADVDHAADATYSERLRVVEAAAADIPGRERAVLDALYAIAGDHLTAAPSDIAARLGSRVTEIAAAGARLERRAVVERTARGWTVTNRLLHRYLTTGDVV